MPFGRGKPLQGAVLPGMLGGSSPNVFGSPKMVQAPPLQGGMPQMQQLPMQPGGPLMSPNQMANMGPRQTMLAQLNAYKPPGMPMYGMQAQQQAMQGLAPGGALNGPPVGNPPPPVPNLNQPGQQPPPGVRTPQQNYQDVRVADAMSGARPYTDVGSHGVPEGWSYANWMGRMQQMYGK
jgi:hypothetical protein